MQPFAPTPYLSDPINVSGVSLHEEIRLSTSAYDRELYDSLSVIYSILVSLDFLESFHLRDSITPDDYHARCAKLIAQYTSYTATLSNAQEFGNLDEFCSRYKIHYPLAVSRLKAGKPAPDILFAPSPPAAVQSQPVQQAVQDRPAKNAASPAKVAETVQNFITLMDALKLSFRAKDQLHPLLSDLMSSLTPGDEEVMVELEGRGKLVKWLIRINQMKVSEEITEEEVRELFFEVEGLYGEYLKTL